MVYKKGTLSEIVFIFITQKKDHIATFKIVIFKLNQGQKLSIRTKVNVMIRSEDLGKIIHLSLTQKGAYVTIKIIFYFMTNLVLYNVIISFDKIRI